MPHVYDDRSKEKINIKRVISVANNIATVELVTGEIGNINALTNEYISHDKVCGWYSTKNIKDDVERFVKSFWRW